MAVRPVRERDRIDYRTPVELTAWLSLAAVVAASIAAGVAIWQARLSRRQARSAERQLEFVSAAPLDVALAQQAKVRQHVAEFQQRVEEAVDLLPEGVLWTDPTGSSPTGA